MKEVLESILSVLLAGATLYIIGFAFVLGSIMTGGTGDDALSQHYKGVIGKVLMTDQAND